MHLKNWTKRLQQTRWLQGL